MSAICRRVVLMGWIDLLIIQQQQHSGFGFVRDLGSRVLISSSNHLVKNLQLEVDEHYLERTRFCFRGNTSLQLSFKRESERDIN